VCERVSVTATNLFSSNSKNKQKSIGFKIENVCKLCCQVDYVEALAWGKIDSFLVQYILFQNSKLKTAVNKQQIS
jgi:hypothetical protein